MCRRELGCSLVGVCWHMSMCREKKRDLERMREREDKEEEVGKGRKEK